MSRRFIQLPVSVLTRPYLLVPLLQHSSDMPFEISLKGKLAMVTGGGRGLGIAIARSLATAGADLALTCEITSSRVFLAHAHLLYLARQLLAR